jgi:hypothetical protein
MSLFLLLWDSYDYGMYEILTHNLKERELVFLLRPLKGDQ